MTGGLNIKQNHRVDETYKYVGQDTGIDIILFNVMKQVRKYSIEEIESDKALENH